jgi:hypothetical protein
MNDFWFVGRKLRQTKNRSACGGRSDKFISVMKIYIIQAKKLARAATEVFRFLKVFL